MLCVRTKRNGQNASNKLPRSSRIDMTPSHQSMNMLTDVVRIVPTVQVFTRNHFKRLPLLADVFLVRNDPPNSRFSSNLDDDIIWRELFEIKAPHSAFPYHSVEKCSHPQVAASLSLSLSLVDFCCECTVSQSVSHTGVFLRLRRRRRRWFRSRCPLARPSLSPRL